MKIIQPFFEDQYIILSWQEIENLDINEVQVYLILEMLQKSPYITFDQMDLDRKKKWEPIDLEKAAKHLSSRYKSSLEFILEEDENCFATFSKNSYQNTAILSLDQKTFEKYDNKVFKEYMRKMSTKFPDFHWAHAKADSNTALNFAEANGLRGLPKSIGYYLTWYSLLSPKGRKNDYTKEALLNAPVLCVEELPNEFIEFFTYEDPFSYYSEATAKEIIKMTKYFENAWTPSRDKK